MNEPRHSINNYVCTYIYFWLDPKNISALQLKTDESMKLFLKNVRPCVFRRELNENRHGPRHTGYHLEKMILKVVI